MKLSKKISSLSPSPTVALNGKAKELAASGTKVYNFAVGEPDFDTPSLVVETAIEAIRKGRTKYGPAGGGLPLRRAIAAKLERDNQLTYSPDEIVVGIGAKEILFHIFLSILNEGDEVLIPAPYWVSYTAHLEAIGAKPVIIPMPKDHHGARLTPEMIEPYVTSRTVALVLTSPNNPAGYIISEAELKRLGDYLKKKDWWIVGDEIYEYMDFDVPHVSLAKVTPELKDRYILVNGMSKGFAMTGWRVGYTAAPKAVAKLVAGLQSHSSTCLPPFVEDASVKALEAGRSLMSREIAVLKGRRDLAVAELGKIPGISFVPPQGAFYIYIDIRDRLKQAGKGADSLRFSEQLLADYHVAMVPGEAFGTEGFLRLSYAVSEEDLVEGIRRLGRALAALS